MGQSGPGITYHTIIDRPEIKSWCRRGVEYVVTLLLWTVWLYWITPIFILILWMAGVSSPAQRLFTRGMFAQLHDVLIASGLAFLFILLSELLWIGYNRFFHGRKAMRRQKVPVVTYRHLYAAAGITRQTVEKARRLRRLEITLTDGKLAIANLNSPSSLRRKPAPERGGGIQGSFPSRAGG